MSNKIVTIEDVINDVENPTFDIEVEVITRRNPHHKGRDSRGRLRRVYAQELDEYHATPRIYIFPKGESILDNFFFGRHNRPFKMYRERILPTVFERVGWPADTKVRWSPKAGCKMCPCSPGFVVTQPTVKDPWDFEEMIERNKALPPRPACLENDYEPYDIHVEISQGGE